METFSAVYWENSTSVGGSKVTGIVMGFELQARKGELTSGLENTKSLVSFYWKQDLNSRTLIS